jgi:hypothetical protein
VQREFFITLYSIKNKIQTVNFSLFSGIRGAIQNCREFEYTAQTICDTNLRRCVRLALSFKLWSANWRLYKCTFFPVLVVFLTQFSWVSVIIKMAVVKIAKNLHLRELFIRTKCTLSNVLGKFFIVPSTCFGPH